MLDNSWLPGQNRSKGGESDELAPGKQAKLSRPSVRPSLRAKGCLFGAKHRNPKPDNGGRIPRLLHAQSHDSPVRRHDFRCRSGLEKGSCAAQLTFCYAL